MRTRLYVVLAALTLVAAPGLAPGLAWAQTPPTRPAPPPHLEGPNLADDPLALAQDALERLMRAFGSMLESLPQYGAPRLNERGDIIVPRLNPKPKKQEEDRA